MATLIDFKCPCCGGAINFDSSLQKMKCPYCDTEFDVSSLIAQNEALNETAKDDSYNWEKEAGTPWQGEDANGMKIYVCNSCGAEIIGDENLSSTLCPYCDNPVVMAGNLSGVLKPDYVIPFKLNKKDAIAGLKKHLEGKRLLPKIFKSENHLDEIKGVYVPFWLFDSDVNATVNYKATKVRVWSDKNYDYTETSHYSILRGGNIGFSHIPVDGSSKMPDDLMESLEPFDFSQAVDFNTAYLAGYLADKYDVDAPHSIGRANERIKKSTEERFMSTVEGYTGVEAQDSYISLYNSSSHYALYPVWLLNTTWNGQKFTFAMNGQTGKFVGDLPLDKKAKTRWFASIFAGVTAAAFAITTLLGLFGGGM